MLRFDFMSSSARRRRLGVIVCRPLSLCAICKVCAPPRQSHRSNSITVAALQCEHTQTNEREKERAPEMRLTLSTTTTVSDDDGGGGQITREMHLRAGFGD